MSERLTLRQVAQQASDRHGGKRGRALGREAEKRGLTLSYTTVDKILAGTYTSRPTYETLDALAELAGLDPARVYEAAAVPLPLAPMAESLPPDADLLTAEQRRVVLDVMREFAKANRRLYEVERARGNQKEEGESRGNTAPMTSGRNQPDAPAAAPPGAGRAPAPPPGPDGSGRGVVLGREEPSRRHGRGPTRGGGRG